MSVHGRLPSSPSVPSGMVQCHAGANDLSSNGLLFSVVTLGYITTVADNPYPFALEACEQCCAYLWVATHGIPHTRPKQ